MNYIMDSSALIAYLEDEPGAENVDTLLRSSSELCFVHAVNLCEVYYGARRAYGEDPARQTIVALQNTGLTIRDDMDEDFWVEAGRIKADFRRISLADCFCAALANRIGAEAVTADHHEFEPLVDRSICRVKFIR